MNEADQSDEARQVREATAALLRLGYKVKLKRLDPATAGLRTRWGVASSHVAEFGWKVEIERDATLRASEFFVSNVNLAGSILKVSITDSGAFLVSTIETEEAS